ncbi:MAG: (Fe-S)-binding protein [Candidatus Krumholzibacteriia bacterium]
MTPPTTGGMETELRSLLRSCVQCGLCLPHCATWLATGDDVQSPRGRLILLDEILRGRADAAEPSFLAAFDQCIGCRACESACPSGVPYSLLEYGQDLAFAAAGSPAGWSSGPALPAPLIRRLSSVRFLRAAAAAATLASGVLRGLLGPGWRTRLARAPGGLGWLSRLLGSLPRSPSADESVVRLLSGLIAAAAGAAAGRVEDPSPSATVGPESRVASPDILFFRGCANEGLMPGTSRRLLELLRRCGCRVEVPRGQVCCGALAAHTGDGPGREDRHRRNREAFGAGPVPADGGPWILVEAAGCGHELKSVPGELAGEVLDATEVLTRLSLPPLRTVPLKVAFHDPCHLRHGQGIVAEPRRLLRGIPGLELVEPAEPEVCCGSGGAWGMRYPDLSGILARRKAENLAATGADLVVTTNPGCLGQIAGALADVAPDLPILPLTDLLWFAARKA